MHERHLCVDTSRSRGLGARSFNSKRLWAQRSALYWKKTTAHTFRKRLDAKNKLGGSFFCSRAGLTDARRIIPTIVSMLTHSNAKKQSAIHEVLKRKPHAADMNDLSDQSRSLVINPVKITTENTQGIYYIIVIDAMDECSASGIV